MSTYTREDELAGELRQAELDAHAELESNVHPQTVLENLLRHVAEVASRLENGS